jgi:hypothetical protein
LHHAEVAKSLGRIKQFRLCFLTFHERIETKKYSAALPTQQKNKIKISVEANEPIAELELTLARILPSLRMQNEDFSSNSPKGELHL